MPRSLSPVFDGLSGGAGDHRMNAMRHAAWQHTILAVYLWAVETIPLGNRNRQKGERLLPALLSGQGIGGAEFGALAFVALPAIVCGVAYRWRSLWFAGIALLVDAVWLWMQIQTWWIPYISGRPSRWQLAYAQGPTTKLLPSFGYHVAPDGMHFVIHVLLVAAIMMALLGVRKLATRRAASESVRSRRTRG